ncbi:YqaJ viral recombinase family protein [Plantibacter sp. YIM 135249]|uniref:YqaJ viral recombinase family nuclease n=1 Tax=Plantibacter sp. YIM 135249 TaxID=3423918 RepID=UPI003D32EA0D
MGDERPYQVLTGESNTPEWLRKRKLGIGASEAAAILGLSGYGTPLSVFLDKTSDAIDESMTESQKWGHRNEAAIAAAVQDEYPNLGRVVDSEGLLQSTRHPFLLGTLDRRILTPEGFYVPLELKNMDKFYQSEWAERVPLIYQVQVQMQILITGAPFGYIAALFGGNHMPEPWRIDADPEFHEQLIDILGRYWRDHVLARVAPEPTVADDLVSLWKGDPSLTIEGGDNLRERWAQYEVLQDQAKAVDNDLAVLKLGIQAAMGEATTLTLGGKPAFTWNPVKAGTVTDNDKLRTEYPDVFNAVQKPKKASRQFLRKKLTNV